MILLSHPTGNENLRQAMRAMQEAGILYSFSTTIGLTADSKIESLPLPGQLKRQLAKRRYAIYAAQLRRSPWRELVRLALLNRPENSLTRHEIGPCSVDGVYRALDRKVARALRGKAGREAQAVYGYEDGCLEHFTVARERGLTTIYELPIAYGPYAHAMLAEEARRRPNWEPTLISTRDSARKLDRKRRELELADVVVCPSAFVEDSIPPELRAGKRLLRMPYGIDPVEAIPPYEPPLERPLRFLYAGSLSQRKGLADLFEAWNSAALPHTELHVMGSRLMPGAFYRELCPTAIFHGPRPRPEVLALMDACDVLVLPSLVEGRALVQLEALGRGLPLLITPNTGGDDLVEPGETGFITPARSPEALAERLAWFSQHRDELPRMHAACLKKAATVSWERYREQLSGALVNILEDRAHG
ncbi:glycosyltransferase family 4 protein [Ruficoccus amylovorans]|uniref:Glycosyltransferase family 4 protein n=1 Tax=Ruficoccus amylovorans TaxID=1804625 RepID=A0A842HG43_9BACT|nr:glycosyltransferase family 4 protein [Ruficoccus amylovorans]MBC2594547.1 glycosyltransferase family 4 protein [Ruficoccus amylovorans]